MASFLVDEQLPPGLAKRLAELGHAAVHIRDIGLGAASDAAIAKEAADRGAILITKDEDFVVRSNLGQLAVPVVWIRIGNVTNRALWERLSPVLIDILDAIDGSESVVEVV